MNLKERDIDLCEEKNIVLIDRIEDAINSLTDDEFFDLFLGNRGSLSFVRSGEGSFKLCEATCICGSIFNVPCQWLCKGEACGGKYCKHYIMHALTQGGLGSK